MNVGLHQYVGMEQKVISILVVLQNFKVLQEIFLLPEDLLPLVATNNYVVKPTLKLYPRFPTHGINLQLTALNVNI